MVATLCQVSVVPALLALATALRFSRRETAFVLIAIGASGWFLANAVYPWPKLHAAAPLLTAIAVLVHMANGPRTSRAHGAALGALSALALLAHGGPVFSLLASPALACRSAVRRVMTPPVLLASGCAAAALLGPWLAYQRWVDPPGNRLVRMHLAGDPGPETRSLSAALLDAYGQMDVATWVQGRLANLRVQAPDSWPPADPVADLQAAVFFRHLAAFDVLVLGLAGVVSSRRADGVGLTLRALVAYALISGALWIVLMLRAGSASVHHGSYATTLLLLIGGAVGLARWGRMGAMLMALHVAGFVAVWLVPRAGVPAFAWSPAALAVLVGSALAATALSRAWLRDEDPSRCR
jgi:hypothetical protein